MNETNMNETIMSETNFFNIFLSFYEDFKKKFTRMMTGGTTYIDNFVLIENNDFILFYKNDKTSSIICAYLLIHESEKVDVTNIYKKLAGPYNDFYNNEITLSEFVRISGVNITTSRQIFDPEWIKLVVVDDMLEIKNFYMSDLLN